MKNKENSLIESGSVVGIIGGGQLGRMTALAAANLGYRVHIYTPERQSGPASQVSDSVSIGSYDDEERLNNFAENVDVVTLEFENIPHESVRALQENLATEICPGWEALYYTKNRIREKDMVQKENIETAAYEAVTDFDSLQNAVKKIGTPSILKTTEMGYDGKGQYVLKKDVNLEHLWNEIKAEASEAGWVLEEFIDFTKEISVVLARDKQGNCKCFPPAENTHVDGILKTSLAPANIEPFIAKKAMEYAKKIADRLSYIGVLAVEFFVDANQQLLVNEIAPRPHNSGHWTMDGCVTSQFEQHVRAICGLPLGNTEALCPVEMTNIIGDDVKNWLEYMKEPNLKLHLYGKEVAKKGRKMGHLNRLLHK